MTATTDAPAWLATRGGELRRGLNDYSWLVAIAGSPQYRITIVPAKNVFSCAITQSINGKRIDQGKSYPTAEAALQGAFVELQAALGW